MSDTPKSDSFFRRADIDWYKQIQFSRQLEKEQSELREGFSKVIFDLQDTIFELRKERDKLQYKLELWMDEVEKWRAIANDNRN